MIFTILGIFLNFFNLIFDLKSFKIIKKNWQKSFYFPRGPRGCDVALRPRGSATRASAEPKWHIHYIYSYITYSIRGIQPPIYREGIRPLSPSGLINPTEFLIFFVWD